MEKHSRIFVAGHNGLVGNSIYELLKQKGYKKLTIISKKKLDLRNFKKVQKDAQKQSKWLNLQNLEHIFLLSQFYRPKASMIS